MFVQHLNFNWLILKLRSSNLVQIDILLVEGKYYGFSGCHRYEVAFLPYRIADRPLKECEGMAMDSEVC